MTQKSPLPAIRYIGVDPGTNVMGYAIIEVQGRKVKAVVVDTINMKNLPSQQLKLKRIFESLRKIIIQYRPVEMAIEAPFFGKNVQSMLKLGRAQGVAMAAGITQGLAITEYSPKKIKQSVTGNGNASKEQVSAMLGHILGLKLKETSLDATDALGAALCHHFQNDSSLNGRKKYSGWDAFLKDNPRRKG